MAAATAHNLLGWIRRAQERYPEAGRRYMKALTLALQAGGSTGAESQEAEAAYRGLSFVQASVHYVGRPEEAEALFREAVAVADEAGVPKDSAGRKWGELRLRANARPTVVAPRTPSDARRVAPPPRPAELQDLVNDLMSSSEHEEAAAMVVAALHAYKAREDRMAAATAHNLLGWIRRAQERYPEAARQHMGALALVFLEGGAAPAGKEAEAAYRGLSVAQAAFRKIGKPKEAEALLKEAVAAADAAGLPRDSPGRKRFERVLRAKSRSSAGVAKQTAAARREVFPPKPAELWDFVNDLMNSQELKKADAAVVAALDAYRAKEDRMAAATAHNLLGWIRRAQERYPEAGRRYMEALTLALHAGGPTGAESQEAEAAYRGLSFVQASVHYVGRPEEAEALFREAVAVADAAGVPQDSAGRKWGELRLRANARPTVAAPSAQSPAREPMATSTDGAEAAGLAFV